MDTFIKDSIDKLYQSWSSEKPTTITPMPQSGSDRQYYRIASSTRQVIAVYNIDQKENQTFIDYTNHFREKNVNMPEILAYDKSKCIYLLEDLGDTTLLQYLEESRKTKERLPETVLDKYKKALAQLAHLQIKGIEGLDIKQYHNPDSFNKQNMLWDLNYFKYCFLKPNKVSFEEQLLEQDFHALADYLDGNWQYFMFRDFQSRNIMLKEEKVYFIDYQGGKKGPLQYDVVSLLFQAKANLPNAQRGELLDYYIEKLQQYTIVDITQFKEKYYGFVLLRTLQVLGAYGFKGYLEQKKHFLDSIPFAIQNLKWLFNTTGEREGLSERLVQSIPNLMIYLGQLVETCQPAKKIMKADKLTVRVQSFSYKYGIPKDPSGNGGGFVFDCRFIHNPGRYQPYKKLTGRDEPVKTFLKTDSTIEQYIENQKTILREAVENYIERGFASLCINFGCTGGQHRSVFCADAIADFIQEQYDVHVILHHREQERKNWKN